MTRLKLSANQNWKFYRGKPPLGRIKASADPHAKGIRVFDVLYDDSEWETVHLPHTVREERLMCSGGRNYQGECWYRKRLILPEAWADKELLLEFEGAMQRVDAWLDGEPLGVCTGGFLPVGFDLTGRGAGEHLLVLRVDNSDMRDVPPGKPQTELDYCYFGGLYRNAWLHVAEKIRFTYAVHEGKPMAGGLYVRYPQVSKERATVRVTASWVNHTACGAKTRLCLLLDGEPVYTSGEMPLAQGGEIAHLCEFEVKKPALWHPYHPILHTLTAQLYADGVLTDERRERIGIRSAQFRPDGFFLNGEELFLSGVNRHQEYAYVGFALPDALQRRDLMTLRDEGVICIRTAHYPPDETFMGICDELGILLVIATPGWQIHPDSVAFDLASVACTRRMIRWHRNHPSALLWEPILNETAYPAYFARQQLAAVNGELDTEAWCACDSVSVCAEQFPVNYAHDFKSERPIFAREYGDFYHEQFGPQQTMRRVRRGKNTGFYPGGERANIRSARERFSCYVTLRTAEAEGRAMTGATIWAGIDHNRGYETNEAAVGQLDFLRLPKYFHYLFAAQQEPERAGVRVFIANEWTEDSPRDVEVYTNAQAVRLLLNGKPVATKDAGGKFGIHPPVLFEGVPWERGTLRAEALISGKVAAVYEVSTPGVPKKLIPEPHFAGVKRWTADGADLLMVHVSVVDERGRVVPDAEPEISFAVEGDAGIVGEGEPWVGADPIRAEAGRTGVLLRAGLHAGKVILRAEAEGLEAAQITLITEKDERPQVPSGEICAEKKRPEYPADRREFFSVPESIKLTQAHRWELGWGKPASASSNAEHAARANRKEVDDAWTAETVQLPQWWSCDLGKAYSLNGVLIMWEKDGVWYDYDIEISQDGKQWTRLIRNRSSGQLRRPDRFAEPASARYVRVFIWNESGGAPVGIRHIDIFGDPNSR